jgi:anti-sigma B factor antagonist
METFGTQASRSNGQAYVRVRGEIDLYTAPQLWETIDAAIAGAPHELVIDLSDVSFLDSTGLSVLVRAHKRLRPVDGAVIVRGAADQVYMALEVTKLTTLLTVESSTPAHRAS